jgi:hypothetical protein
MVRARHILSCLILIVDGRRQRRESQYLRRSATRMGTRPQTLGCGVGGGSWDAGVLRDASGSGAIAAG